MKILVAKDNASGVWHVATDLFQDDDPVNLELDAALFDQDQLARIQPQPDGVILSNNAFHLARGHGDESNSCVLTVDRSVAAFDGSSPEYRNRVLADFDDFVQKMNAHEADFVRPGAGDMFRKILAGVLPAACMQARRPAPHRH